VLSQLGHQNRIGTLAIHICARGNRGRPENKEERRILDPVGNRRCQRRAIAKEQRVSRSLVSKDDLGRIALQELHSFPGTELVVPHSGFDSLSVVG
jgi:hypothetical protein